MTDINQRQGRFIRVPRELYELFRNSRNVMSFFEALTAKVDNSSSGLSDVEQKSTVPFMGMLKELERRIAGIERESTTKEHAIERRVTHLERDGRHKGIAEIERKLEVLERSVATQASLSEIRRDIEDLKRSI